MNILVVGGGGREHAIIKALKESPRCERIYAAPGNAGIAELAECIDIRATDIPGIVDFANRNHIHYVVVAPDDPLVLGMVDHLMAQGIRAFGPDKKAARIEGSKIFSKALMKRYGIPTAAYETFIDCDRALASVALTERFPIVIKADGLALGKGVTIAETREEAEQAIREMMEDHRFGDSGSRIVIEEFLTGPEVSVLAFADGERVVPMVSSMDHKRAFDGNLGPNTGGMGAIAPNPHYTPEIAKQCMREIYLPTIRAMQAEGCPFKGCLYFGLMLTPQGPKVIEYNCRFGDPEAQVVLPLLDGDLLEIMLATTEGTLDQVPVRWRDGAAACVVVASGGYPDQYLKGIPITGVGEAGALENISVYHAGTARNRAGDLVTAGGRVLGVTATGYDLEEALAQAYWAVDKIRFQGSFCRRDIGRY